MGLLDIVPAGVVSGKNLLKVFEYGKFFVHTHSRSVIAQSFNLLFSFLSFIFSS